MRYKFLFIIIIATYVQKWFHINYSTVSVCVTSEVKPKIEKKHVPELFFTLN
jgi:hypothetical protein